MKWFRYSTISHGTPVNAERFYYESLQTDSWGHSTTHSSRPADPCLTGEPLVGGVDHLEAAAGLPSRLPQVHLTHGGHDLVHADTGRALGQVPHWGGDRLRGAALQAVLTDTPEQNVSVPPSREENGVRTEKCTSEYCIRRKTAFVVYLCFEFVNNWAAWNQLWYSVM